MKWEPIDTAPLKAELVLVAVDEGDFFEYYTAFSDGDKWHEAYDGTIISTGEVKYWMHIPRVEAE